MTKKKPKVVRAWMMKCPFSGLLPGHISRDRNRVWADFVRVFTDPEKQRRYYKQIGYKLVRVEIKETK